MTCIAGLILNGRGYLAADSLGSSDTNKDTFTNPKVFRKGRFIIGCTTSYRIAQLLQYQLELPLRPHDMVLEEYVYFGFVNAVRTLLKEHGCLYIKRNRENVGPFMFVIEGRLFRMQQNLSVLESTRGFDACGEGDDYARATLWLYQASQLTAEQRLRLAVETAAEFTPSVGGSVMVLEE